MLPYQDPSHEGNSVKYHTGKPCSMKGCSKPAGTWWGPHWCFKHNVERLDRISATLDDVAQKAELSAKIDEATAGWRALVEKLLTEQRALIRAAGGTITVTKDHLERKGTGESCQYHENGSRTYRAY